MDAGIIGVLGTVLGVLLGGPVTYYYAKVLVQTTHKNAIDIMQRQELNIAAAKLRAAFAPALAQIYLVQRHWNHDRPSIDDFVKTNLLAHASAVEEFRIIVPESKLSAYQEAWEDYRKAVAMDQYALAAEAKIKNVQPGELLENKIHNILQYAEVRAEQGAWS